MTQAWSSSSAVSRGGHPAQAPARVQGGDRALGFTLCILAFSARHEERRSETRQAKDVLNREEEMEVGRRGSSPRLPEQLTKGGGGTLGGERDREEVVFSPEGDGDGESSLIDPDGGALVELVSPCLAQSPRGAAREGRAAATGAHVSRRSPDSGARWIRVEFGNRARLILALVTRVLLHLLCVIGADASNRHDDHGVKAGTMRRKHEDQGDDELAAKRKKEAERKHKYRARKKDKAENSVPKPTISVATHGPTIINGKKDGGQIAQKRAHGKERVNRFHERQKATKELEKLKDSHGYDSSEKDNQQGALNTGPIVAPDSMSNQRSTPVSLHIDPTPLSSISNPKFGLVSTVEPASTNNQSYWRSTYPTGSRQKPMTTIDPDTQSACVDDEDDSWLHRDTEWKSQPDVAMQNSDETVHVIANCVEIDELQRSRRRDNSQQKRNTEVASEGDDQATPRRICKGLSGAFALNVAGSVKGAIK
ncbi:hypothetical protein EJB05_02574, partial [Eragrostis curvula]